MIAFPNLIAALRQALAETPGNEALRAHLERLERGHAAPAGPFPGLRVIPGGAVPDPTPLAASS